MSGAGAWPLLKGDKRRVTSATEKLNRVSGQRGLGVVNPRRHDSEAMDVVLGPCQNLSIHGLYSQHRALKH